ncbi:MULTISPECIES: glycoside hydrolase family 3 C-terminal domain-containing protein [unclassified Paenibacillus]|uniref:glycoside hydrolase family 3 C-terminal domain-containing protein n=1 Tax=unclassified Paenibacillus TaxID=185978 RepID=UPI0030FAAFF8
MNIETLVGTLTLEEKAGLCSGKDDWLTKAVERLNIPSIRTSDGPHGLRTFDDQPGANNSKPAVCFPAGCATAASFDRALLSSMGEALGREAQAMDVQVLLGPGINIKRSPLCGRNFEYFSEDPMLSGELGAAFVNGVQSQGVGTSLKHFFANNQEYRRMDASSEMDERTMREIYLPAFERVVKQSQPWTIMASYNKIGGTYSTENKQYLTDLLREEWGFEGLVISDWGATHNRVKAVAAGTDLTMPSATKTDQEIVKAVQEGELSESELDRACIHLLKLVFKSMDNRKEDVTFDYDSDHALARKISAESMVLLKNDNNVLPLKKNAKIAFIGAFAKAPRYQGGGSSHINSYKVTNAFDAAAQLMSGNLTYAQGYHLDSLEPDADLVQEAVAAAKDADVAVIFAGLPDSMESEGFDRGDMRMPHNHNELIAAVSAAQPNTVVVLHNGSPVEMPWVKAPKAILEVYLGGQAVGEATVQVLFGEENPSGRLPESFPVRLEDNPSYLFFPGENGVVDYSERMFVGYRYYESKKMDVLFPFGHGLSYTTFSYSNLRVSATNMTEDDTVTVSVDVTNTGSMTGKEVVQLYIAPHKGEIIRPVRELKGFEKIELNPREMKTVTFTLGKRDFAYWNMAAQDWAVETGEYTVQIGYSSYSIAQETTLHIEGKENPEGMEYTMFTPIKDFIRHPIGKTFWEANFGKMAEGMVRTGLVQEEALAAGMQLGNNDSALMIQPISIMTAFVPELDGQPINEILEQMNIKYSAQKEK